jgi:predicted MarR family transcription regulator
MCRVCGRSAYSPDVLRQCVVVSGDRQKHDEDVAATVKETSTHGPGTELSNLLKRFGINPTPTCACRAKAAEMDALGCDECERPERIDEVVAVMRTEAEARGLPFLDLAGRMLVRRAIQNARRNA